MNAGSVRRTADLDRKRYTPVLLCGAQAGWLGGYRGVVESPDMLTRSSVFAGAVGETANLNNRAIHSWSTVQRASRMAWRALLHDQTSVW